MPDFNRMIKDKATILAIVKYLLLILVIGITIYAGFRSLPRTFTFRDRPDSGPYIDFPVDRHP